MQEICVTLCHLFVPMKKRLRKAFKKSVSAIFDGNTRLGEAFAVVLRFVLKGKIAQRLIKLQMLAKPMNAGELAHEVISVLQVTYRISSKIKNHAIQY